MDDTSKPDPANCATRPHDVRGTMDGALPASPESILLAHVRHGSPLEPLAVELREAPVGSGQEYYCVAYIPSGKDEQIVLDGHRSHIDAMLHDALRALRPPGDAEAVFWAEGLTDGTGTGTKTRQPAPAGSRQTKVAFGHAEGVYLWTGDAGSSSEKAIGLLESLAARWRLFAGALRLPDDWSQATPQQLTGVVQRVKKGIATKTLDLPLAEDAGAVEAANALTSARFFRHVKAISSVVLAKEPVLSTGSMVLSWADYCDALSLIAASGGLLPVRCDPVHLQLVASIRIAVRRYQADASSLELLPMLQQSRQTDCEDARDRVFSILPIISPSRRVSLGYGVPQAPLSVDHSTTQQQLFLDTARYIVGERQDLLLWNDTPSPCKPSRLAGLPSWVPDWSDTTDAHALPLRRSMALRSWENAPCVQRVHRPMTATAAGVLHAQAHILTTVTAVSPCPFTASNFASLTLDTLQMLPPSQRLRHKDDYWRTLMLDSTGGAGAGPPHPSLGASWLAAATGFALRKALDTPPGEEPPDPASVSRAAAGRDPTSRRLAHMVEKGPPAPAAFSAHLSRQSAGRSFFVTGKGLLGLGHWEGDWAPGHGVREGDAVAVFAGGYFPYVLRRVGPSARRFTLVGECHLQGAMEAEVLLLGRAGWLGRASWDEVDVWDVEIV